MTNSEYLTEDLPTMIAALEEGLRGGIAAGTENRFEDACNEAGIEIAFGRVITTEDFDLAAFGELVEAFDY